MISYREIIQMISSIIRSIDCIEEHLRAPIRIEKIAAIAAGYSPYHFIRLFHSITNETPGSYLRKRRLSEAAIELVSSRKPLIEIAADFQFQSQEAFTRSFAKHFGIPPGKQRRIQKYLHLTPRAIITESSFTNHPTCEPYLVDWPELHLAGVMYRGENSGGELAQVWSSLIRQMKDLPQVKQPLETYGVWTYPDSFQTSRELWYLAGVSIKPGGEIPAPLVSKILTARRYAVFEHTGSLRHIQQTYVYAYGEWLPRSGFQPVAGFDLEYYDDRFSKIDRDDSVLSILIPVSTKTIPQ